MAIHKTEALVLRNYKIRESSLIASVFTRDFGKLSCVAKGIRRQECRFASRLTPFSLNQIVFYRNRRGMLHTLSECVLREGFYPLREDLQKLAGANYFIEIIDEFTRWEDKNEELFYLLLNSLRRLAAGSYQERVIRWFEIKSLVLAGFGPKLDACAGCGQPVNKPYRFGIGKGGLICPLCFNRGVPAETISPAAVEVMRRLKAHGRVPGDFSREHSTRTGEELRAVIRKFILFHIEKPLKSLTFMEELRRGRD